MRSLALFSILFFAGLPSIAQLGSADIEGFQERSIIRSEWDAWCGEKRIECKVKFKDGRLSVDASEGIYPNQVISIAMFRWCRQRAFGGPNCFLVSADKDITLKYFTVEGEPKIATFTIKNWEAAPNFYSDLGTWSGKALHWIPADSLLGGKADRPDFKKGKKPTRERR